MKRDFFANLPSEIITNILLRLPIRSIVVSKCVCKPWLDLLESDEFVNSHLAKSVPTLAVLAPKKDSNLVTIFEFKDGEEDLERHDLHYNPLTRSDLPHPVIIEGSANGLLFLLKFVHLEAEARCIPEAHYVCNPITRKYVEFSCPKEFLPPYLVTNPKSVDEYDYAYAPDSVNYGFGASKISGKLKVVRIFQDLVDERQTMGRIIPASECHVHTLGTESWRRVQPAASLDYSVGDSCAFLNGNLHWLVSDSDSKLCISCFDLETEHFSTFCCPPLNQGSYERIRGLSVLGDCLCFCDNHHTGEDGTVIWLMKEYGVEKSWNKEYVFNRDGHSYIIGSFDTVYPIKVFKEGDILMLGRELFYYSSKSETVEKIDILGPHTTTSILLTPSFLSLKSLGMENVLSF